MNGETVWAQAMTPESLASVAGVPGRWKRWVSPTSSNGGMVFGMGELAPGDVFGWDEHPEPEIFFVLEGMGEARWRDGDSEHRAALRPGVAFFKIGGIPHQMLNLGSGPLRGVFFKIGVA